MVALGALAAWQLSETINLLHYLKSCAYHSRTSYGQKMALKIASLYSNKHHSLKHQTSCLMALRSLWGQCVPHVLLAGALTGHGHGYGLGTTLLHGRHPEPGTNLLLTVSECASHNLALTAYCKRETCYNENVVMQATYHCCHWPRKLSRKCTGAALWSMTCILTILC